MKYDEWLKKAETDLKASKILLSLEPWISCFHAQQAVEKFLKAFLVHHQRRFRKTHDLDELLNFCIEIDPDFESLFTKGFEKLNLYSVTARYPENFNPSFEDAEEAIEIAEKVKEFVLKKLEKGKNK